MHPYEQRLADNLPDVLARVDAAKSRGRFGQAVRLVAVTKGHSVDAVRAAVAAGLTDCGENRVQELADKVDALGRRSVTWHLIGHLQRNKVRKAIELFEFVHSIDSPRLARELSKEAVAAGIIVRGLIQVNASGEVAKGGIDAAGDTDVAIAAVREIIDLPNLEIGGLMTMAPFVAEESVLRATFRRTRELLERSAAAIPAFTGRELSMGMSNDFEIAIEEGSTMIRLGTILFGERTK